MSSSIKQGVSLRPNSAKVISSPSKKSISQSNDIFLEFESFRSQIKKEYNEKLLLSRSNFQEESSKIKPVSIGKPPITTSSSTNSLKSTLNTLNFKPSIYSSFPLKSPNKENNEKTSSFIDQSGKKGSISQIENLKRSLKELSAKKVDKNRESLLSSLHINKENRSLQNSDIKKPNDFKALLTGFEQAIKPKNLFDSNSNNYRFGTSGALNEIENRAKLLIPSPKKTKNEFLSESSNKKTRVENSFDKAVLFNKFDEKKILTKIFELQDAVMDLTEQELGDCSTQFLKLFILFSINLFIFRLAEELIKLSSVIMLKVKKTGYYRNKYQ